MTQRDPFGIVGRTVSGTFRVETCVAEGGFGVVYRADHKYFRSPVALKVLKVPRGLPREVRRHFWEELRREAEVQFRLSALTEHVVRPLHVGEVEVGRDEPLPVMALEWLEGMDLDAESKLRRETGQTPRSLPELLDLLGGPAEAIHLSHNLEREGGLYSVVHRDIKPENLFITHTGGRQVVKVLDFGTSKVGRMMHVLAGDPTNTGRPAQFSPAYGAPEQWVPDSLGQTGPWTDVWGMALTLVELMKGEHLCSGNVQKAMVRCLDKDRRPTPRSHGIDVSDAVESAFSRALAVDPRYRTQSIRDLWCDLRVATQPIADPNDAPDEAHEADAPFERDRRRRRRPAKSGAFPITAGTGAAPRGISRTGTDEDGFDTVRDFDDHWHEA